MKINLVSKGQNPFKLLYFIMNLNNVIALLGNANNKTDN